MATKPKRARDPNQLAKFIADVATGRASLSDSETPSVRKAASRKGGLKGGKARMVALSEAERVQLAQRAAAARWKEAPARAGASGKRSVKGER